MADYDRRQSGGHYNHNSRKRRYRDDDDHYDRRQQRRRTDSAPPTVRLRRQLLSIADSPLRRWSEEIQSLARLVADHYDDETVRGVFVDLVAQMAVEQPLKTPFIAAVVLVANTLKPDVVDVVLTRLAQETEASIVAGEWREVKLNLRLLACLQACLEGDGVFPVLEDLFSRAADLQTASSEDTIGTEIVKIILLTIPYIMAAAPDKFVQNAADLMDKTDVIASEPHVLQALVDPYHPEVGKDSPTASLNVTMLLQKQLQAEAANNWALSCLPRPWQMPLEEIESEDKLANAPKHALPGISIPAAVIAGPRPLFPEVHFSAYPDQEVDSVPSPTNIAASLIRDGLVDTINVLNINRNIAARYLMDIDCYFADGTFVKRATPFDELRNMPPERSTWKPEDVAVDTVFSQLFQLPAPECKLVYYHSLLTEACKLAPAAIAPSLGRAIRYMYQSNPRMDLQLSYRFVDWFSHHLSNFGFTWKWTEWADDASLPELHPRMWFLRGALDKEVRLSFAQRIQKTLPEAYQGLIGPEKEKDVPDFKFKNPDVPFSAEGQELAALLRRKAPDEELQPVIDNIHTRAKEQGRDPLVTSTDVFVTGLLWVGSKSLSHVLACVERTKARLLDAGNESSAAREQIVASVMAYWHAHPGVALSIVEKLLNYSILTPLAVVGWALAADRADKALGEPHVFELVSNTAAKVTSRARQVLTSPDADATARQRETAAVRDVFAAVNDALAAWVGGNDEPMDDGNDEPMDDGSQEALVRRWAQRWQRVFKRLAAMEEAFIADAERNKTALNGGDGDVDGDVVVE